MTDQSKARLKVALVAVMEKFTGENCNTDLLKAVPAYSDNLESLMADGAMLPLLAAIDLAEYQRANK
jgi:hypothetical protein